VAWRVSAPAASRDLQRAILLVSSSRTSSSDGPPTPYTPRVDFDRLIAEGLNVDVETHWGAGFLRGRYRVEEPDWSYEATARQILAQAESALDMGTGEGGVLASLVPPGVGHSMTR
jgi:hypothetical protein